MTPLVRGNLQKKRKKKQTWFWHKLKANSIAEEKVRGIWREPTQNLRTQGIMSIWGLTFQVTDKLLRVTIRPFTRWCLDLWTCSEKKFMLRIFWEFGTRFCYNFILFSFVFFWFEMTTNINFRYINLCNILNQQQIFNKQIGWHSLIHVALCGM